jgi:hypothetical protein
VPDCGIGESIAQGVGEVVVDTAGSVDSLHGEADLCGAGDDSLEHAIQRCVDARTPGGSTVELVTYNAVGNSTLPTS